MENIYTILELPREASGSETEEAYQARYEHWLSIQANRPERKSEAQEQIRRLEDAYEKYRQGLASGQVAGLEVRDRPSSGGTTASRPSVENKDACPHCRYKENPSNARFCLECNGQLFQKCPKCSQELPWHYQACHHCGVNINAFLDQQKRNAAEVKAHLIRTKREELKQIQEDLQLVKSPPLSVYFNTKTGAKVRKFAGEGSHGCRDSVSGVVVVFGACFCSFTITIIGADIVSSILDYGSNSSVYITTFDSNLSRIIFASVHFILAWFLFVVLSMVGAVLQWRILVRKPALENLQNREAQIRHALKELGSN